MPELRRCPITRRWAIIATERAVRPNGLRTTRDTVPPAISPFAAGNEHMTPPEIHAVRAPGSAPNGPGWRVRVVPNKHPALRVEGDLDKRPVGLYDHMNGIGAHEVIIESPDPDFRLQRLPREHLVDALETYRVRMQDLQHDSRFKFALLFRNHGAASGATVAHGHAQLIALPVVPAETQRMLDGAQQYYRSHERNIFDDIIRQEVDDGRRLVHDAGPFVLIAPYASRVPFELWIVPRFHATRYETANRDQLEALAGVLALALDRLDRGLGDPAYNLVIQSAPYGMDDVPWYRWHIQIMPNLTRVAGFELGSGFFINPTAPEEAAEFLRSLPA
ncbi:MAG: DUF4931 domain-containing protein [Myxococcales bacterium]|nr:DUF4931 domain-containing protein [Myxococcales bacterium]MCB9523387.1 DUF4931 domain-containing protein [Myxococcales bacterium]